MPLAEASIEFTVGGTGPGYDAAYQEHAVVLERSPLGQNPSQVRHALNRPGLAQIRLQSKLVEKLLPNEISGFRMVFD